MQAYVLWPMAVYVCEEMDGDVQEVNIFLLNP